MEQWYVFMQPGGTPSVRVLPDYLWDIEHINEQPVQLKSFDLNP